MEMQQRILQIAMAVILVSTQNAKSAETRNQDLVETCAKKTMVMGYNESKILVQVGESLDEFCSGYIRASYSAYRSINKCQIRNDDPAFLLSVYQRYLKDNNISASTDAFKTLMLAFNRIPNCKTTESK